MPLSAPAPLTSHHQFAEFTCGVPALDDWLKRRALANQASGGSRTFVICEQDVLCEQDKVIGYYALASGAVNIAASPDHFRRNIPDPIPVVILARLAVDHAYQGRSLGRALFRDGAARVLYAAEAIGIRGILVHGISDDAKAFYLALGLEPSPIEPMTLMATLADMRKSLE